MGVRRLLGLCEHRWTVADKTIMPSHVEIMHQCGQKIVGGLTGRDMVQKLVLIRRCEKCGDQRLSEHTSP